MNLVDDETLQPSAFVAYFRMIRERVLVGSKGDDQELAGL